MSEYIFMSRGNEKDYAEFMDLINLTFGFEDESVQFLRLLPKLYKPECKPVENNVVLKVNDEMRSAVGLFYNKMNVCSEELLCGGIGNVAVHPDHRGKGYMKAVMAYCLDEMKQKMCDISFLGGQRQRYGYFSFQPGGICIRSEFNVSNFRHLFGSNYRSAFVCREVTAETDPAVEYIEHLHNDSPCKMYRDHDKYFDIIKSWRHRPFVVFDKSDKFIGYFITDEEKKWITEFRSCKKEDIKEMTAAMFEACGQKKITLNFPEFEKDNIMFFENNAENISYNHVDMFSVFNFEKVLRAFLKLKTTYAKLPDGELKIRILGEKTPENLKIILKNNTVTLTESYEYPNFILTHDEAMKLFFALYSDKRYDLPPECASWFPLPLYIYQPDNV